MKEVLVFAGTTEGRLLTERLEKENIPHTVCVATEYGALMLEKHPLRTVHVGRMNQEEIQTFISSGNYAAVIDATHPYAELVTENIRQVTDAMELPYFRVERVTDVSYLNDDVCHFKTVEECVRALEKTEGNILLTTGSKELKGFCSSEALKKRLYIRVLPAMESLTICEQNGIKGKQIIAMQGPFSVEMNEAMIRQYHIAHLVTKESGVCGGYGEKLEAAERTDTMVYVIDRREEEKR